MAFRYQLHYFDFLLLFFTKILRMFSFGMLAVFFADFLLFKGLDIGQRSTIDTLTLYGTIGIYILLTTQADRIGKAKTLMLLSLLKILTGIFFAVFRGHIILSIICLFGSIFIQGIQMDPFMPIEQSILARLVEKCTKDQKQAQEGMTLVFGYSNLAGFISQAAGAAFTKYFIYLNLQEADQEDVMKDAMWIYNALTVLSFFAYFIINRREIKEKKHKQTNLLQYLGIKQQNVCKTLVLSTLFFLDAFSGIYIVQSFFSFYYERKYFLYFGKIGNILFIFGIISRISGVLSAKIVKKIGTIATMIYTHLPSNIFLVFIGLTTNPTLSVFLLFCRFCISQMDVPARQAYVSMSVSSEQRSTANGIANISRSFGLYYGLSMRLNVDYIEKPVDSLEFSYPFLIAGGLKLLYDFGLLLIWISKSKDRQSIKENAQLPYSKQLKQYDMEDTIG